jgi:hypothetical protein
MYSVELKKIMWIMVLIGWGIVAVALKYGGTVIGLSVTGTNSTGGFLALPF